MKNLIIIAMLLSIGYTQECTLSFNPGGCGQYDTQEICEQHMYPNSGADAENHFTCDADNTNYDTFVPCAWSGDNCFADFGLFIECGDPDAFNYETESWYYDNDLCDYPNGSCISLINEGWTCEEILWQWYGDCPDLDFMAYQDDYDCDQGTGTNNCYENGGLLDCTAECFGDAVDDCAGECNGDAVVDECGVCGGPGAIYECGCVDMQPFGVCDCDGNIVDECGECGGNGTGTDCNNDGIDDVCEDEYDAGYDEGFNIGALSGDSNGDGVLNVLDLVYFVEIIVNGD
jgi:hypothetical protein